MTDFVEAGFDVRLEHPSIIDGLRGEVMDFGNCVLRPAVRAEPIRARLEIRLEDGLEHQFPAFLEHPAGASGNPGVPAFPGTSSRGPPPPALRPAGTRQISASPGSDSGKPRPRSRFRSGPLWP